MLRFLMFFLSVAANAPNPQEPSDRLAPPGWVGNPWGPAANRARAEGRIPIIPMTSGMTAWDRWGRANLRDGDILFRRADARILHGTFPASRFIANITNSPFSHTGIVEFRGGHPFVYDTTDEGVRLQPLWIWSLDNLGPIGVKRVKDGLRSVIPAVLDYCRRAYEEQTPWDPSLDPGDDELYCVEMTEKAFRSAGLPLSEPVRVADMERAGDFMFQIRIFEAITPFLLEKPINRFQVVYCPGNERHGLWASPDLRTVVAPPSLATGRTDSGAGAVSRAASGD